MEYINIIACELKYERDRKDSFKLDMDRILEVLFSTIEKNRQDILCSENITGDFDQWLSRKKTYLMSLH